MKLFDHQKKGVELLSEHDGFGLFWDMGSGKTLVMLMQISNLALSGEVKNVLWVAPKSALGAVPRDIEMLRENGLGYRADAIDKVMTLMNYEKLSRTDSKWRKLVDETDWDCVVLDEAHCIAKPTSNRTKYLIGNGKTAGVATKAKYRYAMTGTPVTNSRLEDFYTFMKFVEGGAYYSYPAFKKRYLRTRFLPGTYIELVEGYTNTEELLDDIASFSQSVTKEECLDLPECMPDNIIKIPFKVGKNKWNGLTTKQTYEDAMQNVVIANDEVFDNPLVKTLRMRQIASGHIKSAEGSNRLNCDKCSYAMELIENNPNKTVVFYEFTNSFDVLTEALDKAKIPYMYLNGAQKDKNVWREFQKATADECRVMLVQYKSGNAGIDLFTATDTIYYEPCQSSTVLDQSRSRTHRNGVTRACTFTFLLTEDTIEEDMYEALKAHEDFNEQLWVELKRKENEHE